MAMQKEGSENKTRKQKRAYYSTTIPANQTETIAIQPIKHSQYPWSYFLQGNAYSPS